MFVVDLIRRGFALFKLADEGQLIGAFDHGQTVRQGTV